MVRLSRKETYSAAEEDFIHITCNNNARLYCHECFRFEKKAALHRGTKLFCTLCHLLEARMRLIGCVSALTTDHQTRPCSVG